MTCTLTNRTDLRGGGGTGNRSRLSRRRTSPRKNVVTYPLPIFSQPVSCTFRGLERGIRGFERRAETLTFDHSNMLVVT